MAALRTGTLRSWGRPAAVKGRRIEPGTKAEEGKPARAKREALGNVGNRVGVLARPKGATKPEEGPKKKTSQAKNRLRILTRTKAKRKPAAAPPTSPVTEQDEPEALPSSVLDPPSEVERFRLPVGVPDIDVEDDGDPQMVSDNVKAIYRYLRLLEREQSTPPKFLAGTPITPRMRAVLVNWLAEVHLQFKLLQETLYLTVALLDRYLAVEGWKVKKSQLQLVGVTAMLIASKYEETHIPEVGDFVYISDNAYSAEEILQMELRMLRVLDFKLGRPLSIHFLRRNSKAGMVDVQQHIMAKYLLELALTEYGLAHVAPSMVGAAALLLSTKLVSEEDNDVEGNWKETFEFYSGYNLDETNSVVLTLAQLALTADSSKFRAAYTKYATSSRQYISVLSSEQSKTLSQVLTSCGHH